MIDHSLQRSIGSYYLLVLSFFMAIPNLEGYVAYVLLCAKGRKYKGYSGHFKARMIAHFLGKGGSATKGMKPVSIYYLEEYNSKKEAMDRERFFKSYEGGEFLKSIEPLNIIPDLYELLSTLTRHEP